MDQHVIDYVTGRWPNLTVADVRRRIRAVRREERAHLNARTKEQLQFDVLVRVTQLYEIEIV
jgi:hypothetical protein